MQDRLDKSCSALVEARLKTDLRCGNNEHCSHFNWPDMNTAPGKVYTAHSPSLHPVSDESRLRTGCRGSEGKPLRSRAAVTRCTASGSRGHGGLRRQTLEPKYNVIQDRQFNHYNGRSRISKKGGGGANPEFGQKTYYLPKNTWIWKKLDWGVHP